MMMLINRKYRKELTVSSYFWENSVMMHFRTSIVIIVLSVWLIMANVIFVHFDPTGFALLEGVPSAVEPNVEPKSQLLAIFETIPFSNMNPKTNLSYTPPTIVRNYIYRKHMVDKEDIVLAAHLSTSKFENLLIQLKYWKGPASISIYIKSESDIEKFISFTEEKREQLVNVTFHLVMEKTDMPYPQNILRNVAMKTIETDYFLAMDVDLIPMPEGCHDGLLEVIRKNATEAKNMGKKKTLFVLPAFSLFTKENQTHAFEYMLPQTKEEAIAKVKDGEMDQFWKHQFQEGHRPTDYSKWLNLTETDSVERTDFYDIALDTYQSLNYEPYILGKTSGIPRYWEEFRGFGWDKISFFAECFMSGYRYAVFNDFYCMHLDHPETTLEEQAVQQARNQPIWSRFRKDLVMSSDEPISLELLSMVEVNNREEGVMLLQELLHKKAKLQ